jgi:hypothetical protein
LVNDALAHAGRYQGGDIAGRRPPASGTPTGDRLALLEEVAEGTQDDRHHDCWSMMRERVTA